MNGTLSHIAKDYLRELRRHLYEYKVDDATSAALLADAREGLTGLDDDAAAEQIGRLGRAEDVAASAAQEQAQPVPERPAGIAVAGWVCFGVGLLGLACAFVNPFLGTGLALAALIWAIAGYRRDPKDYRFARWAAIGAVIANAIVWLVLLAGFALFVPVERTVEGTSEPVEVESSAVHAER